MVMRAIFSGSRQIFEEVCEHCGEKVRDLHVSEITVKAPNDPREVTVKDASNQNVRLKTAEEKITEISSSYIRRGLLDDSEARAAKTNRQLKYGIRPEAMCSESIDIDAGVTQSFCYRVAANPTHTRFQKVVGGRTLSASFARAEKTDITGSRMGVDRKGNVIKLKRYKNVRLDTGEVEKDDSNREITRKKGPQATSWFENLNDKDQKTVITTSQECKKYVDKYGEEVKTMKVVARYKNRSGWKKDIQAHGCKT